MSVEESRDTRDCGLQVVRPLPLAQYLGIGRQLCDLLTDDRRMRRVVAGHDQHWDAALANEFAADAEHEIAAEHVVAEPVKDALELGPFFADTFGPCLHEGPENIAIVSVANRILQDRRRNPPRSKLAEGVRQNDAPMQPPMT